MLCIPGIAKKNRIRIKVESKRKHIYNRRLLINVSLVIPTRVLYLNLSTRQLA
ncbi:Bgt-20202 [Blumeria graminis f. sp. tritici]|uniref:Bgt-20202 n=2 Tax=Blumeria graminis f. sp. tritici TaxID=62690 RepID=A0A381L7V7_BLUGR|nr:Bgt-20202 [Blumeria graminis f. sp. tritici]